jgi:DNA polymerase III delta prime subunit
MKSLNHKEISRAFNRFLVWFAGLLLLTTVCVYSCQRTSEQQAVQLIQQKEAFDRYFIVDATLADRVDSLYTYMNMLNTSQIRNDRQMQRLITKKKEEFIRQVNQEQKTQKYFTVYNRLLGHINEMLLVKDSLNRAILQESDMREDLRNCLNRAVEQNRQRKR